MSSVGSFFSYVNDGRSQEPEAYAGGVYPETVPIIPTWVILSV